MHFLFKLYMENTRYRFKNVNLKACLIFLFPSISYFLFQRKRLEISVKICFLIKICGALRNLGPFVQFKRRKTHPWRSVNFSKVAGSWNFTNINIPPWVFFTHVQIVQMVPNCATHHI